MGGSTGWEEVLKGHVGQEFELVEVIVNDKVVGRNWWLANPETIAHLDTVPLSERVERAVLDVLNREVKVSFDETLQQIFTKFPNSMTPATKNVRDIMSAISEKAPGGKWRLRPEIKARESQHSEMVRYLVELGQKAGYDVWAAPPETKLPGVLSKLPRPLQKNRRVPLIDVLWLRSDVVTHAFEVENTTGFIAAIARGSNLPIKTGRFFVLPEERDDELNAKLADPSVAQDYHKYGWKRVYYNRLQDHYERSGHKKKLSRSFLKEIVGKPMVAKFGAPLRTARRRKGRQAHASQLPLQEEESEGESNRNA